METTHSALATLLQPHIPSWHHNCIRMSRFRLPNLRRGPRKRYCGSAINLLASMSIPGPQQFTTEVLEMDAHIVLEKRYANATHSQGCSLRRLPNGVKGTGSCLRLISPRIVARNSGGNAIKVQTTNGRLPRHIWLTLQIPSLLARDVPSVVGRKLRSRTGWMY